MTVAEIILSQLGGRKFIVMTGAKNLLDHGSALSMRIPSSKDKFNYVKITLDPSDTYTVEFGRVWGTSYRVIETMDGIYNDMLRDIFEERTGLFTSLGTMGR